MTSTSLVGRSEFHQGMVAARDNVRGHAARAEALKRTIDDFHIGRETMAPGRVLALVG